MVGGNLAGHGIDHGNDLASVLEVEAGGLFGDFGGKGHDLPGFFRMGEEIEEQLTAAQMGDEGEGPGEQAVEDDIVSEGGLEVLRGFADHRETALIGGERG